ncbi:ATP-binding protein [Asaia siamensis]
MSYVETALWKSAFVERRTDSSAEEQARFADCYRSMRERAKALASKIARDLPHMTVHDVTHLDALWEMGSLAAGGSMQLNPAEAFVFGGAILLHDAAMTLAAFPGGMAELREQREWKDFHARYTASLPPGGALSDSDPEARATSDALRILHAKQAEKLPLISWQGPRGEKFFIIEDEIIRNFYGQKIGKIAYSHWWSIGRVEEEFSRELGACSFITNSTVDLLKVSCLLRVADAMHLDQRRAPAFEFSLCQPRGVSANHWDFQGRMAKPYVRGDALVYTAQPPFEIDSSDAWWTAFDTLQMVDCELRDVDRLLRDKQKETLIVRRVDGAQSPRDLAQVVETLGWTPVDSTIRISDVPNIVATLGGSKLYGDTITAPVRELIQNGLDAITARRRLQNRPSKWGELRIILEQRNDGFWLCFEDNGVGMSQSVLTGPLIDFGNSFWKSMLAIQEFPGLSAAGMKSRGKYGIGFFSIFMLGDQVRVISRRYDRDARSGHVLEFRHGLGSRPNLRDADIAEAPVDGGTRIEVRLKIDPRKPGGLLYPGKTDNWKQLHTLRQLISMIAPACDVQTTVICDGGTEEIISAGDWTEISSATLLDRIAGKKSVVTKSSVSPWEKLTLLRDEGGKIFGRACIDPSIGWSRSGLLTVEGLAANHISHVKGILIGVETTAARDLALPIVPPEVLAAWSSEQASLISDAAISDDQKAKAAAIVSACGGDIAGLPIVCWQGEWMNTAQFRDAIKLVDRIEIHDGLIEHEDSDDVTGHSFDNFFEITPMMAYTVENEYSNVYDGWIQNISKQKMGPISGLVKEIISRVWDNFEEEFDTVIVGTSGGTEIYRGVTIYALLKKDDECNNF